MPSKSAIEAGRAFLKLLVDDDQFRAGLTKTSRFLDSWGQSFQRAGLKLAVAGEAILAPFQAATYLFIREGSELQDMSDRTGVAVESLSELKYALEQTGSELASAERALTSLAKFMRQVEEGSDTARAVVSQLGLSFDELRNKTPDERLRLVLSALGGISDASKLTALTVAVLGKSGTNLIPLIRQFEKLSAEARELGLIMTDEDAKAADELGDAFTLVRSVVNSLARELAKSISPNLIRISENVTSVTIAVREWVAANQPLAQGIAVFGAAVSALGTSLSATGVFMRNSAVAVSALASVLGFLLSPLGLIVAALAAAAIAFLDFGKIADSVTRFFSSRFAELGTVVGETIGGMADALQGGDLVAAANVLWAGLKLAWLEGTKGIRATWRDWTTYLLNSFSEVASGIQVIWAELVAGIKNVWASVIQNIAREIDDFIIEFKLFFADDEEYDRLLKRREGLRKAYDKLGQESSAQTEKEKQERLDAIEAERKKRADAIKEGNSDLAKAAQDELKKARREFDKKRAAAREKKLDDGLSGAPAAAAALGLAGFGGGSSRFAFGGRNIEQKLGSDNVQQKILGHLASIDKNLKQAKPLRVGGK